MSIDRSSGEFIVIGENIHATRILLKKGKRFVAEADREAITFTTVDGIADSLVLPEWARSGQDYDEGRVKHVRIAIQIAMNEGEGAETALAYLEQLVVRQQRAGAAFIDINVDEVSPKPAIQDETLTWVVGTVQAMTALPLSIDSSSVSLLEAGLERCDMNRDRPMLNSASLERLEALDIASAYNARVVVSAAGDAGMPEGAEQRIENASAMVDAALAKGVALDDLFVDPLIFPIAVDGAFGRHALEAIRKLRERYGPDIHITGGFSNVSFGIPARKIINDVFLRLAIEAGADSGIVDPVASQLSDVLSIDTDSETYRLAEDVLMGRDEHCSTYISAWRQKQLQPLH
jgi:5-methyltetrahydrofolate corrinoid/iron sulfur protein methyltransferase